MKVAEIRDLAVDELEHRAREMDDQLFRLRIQKSMGQLEAAHKLKALEPCWLTDRQIEAARVAMTRFIKRGGKIWVRVFPDKPVTKKPQETRMGKGKGAPEEWVCVVRPGRILFEMEGVNETDAREAMRLAAAKLPIKTKFATRFAEEKAS